MIDACTDRRQAYLGIVLLESRDQPCAKRGELYAKVVGRTRTIFSTFSQIGG